MMDETLNADCSIDMCLLSDHIAHDVARQLSWLTKPISYQVMTKLTQRGATRLTSQANKLHQRHH